MNLYTEDYTKELSPEVKAEYDRLRELEIINRIGGLEVRNSLFRQYPKAVRHYNSLFPNNYMDVVELKDVERLKDRVDEFKSLFNSENVGERDISNFIRNNRAYFIIASLLSYFSFGHHEAYLFPEFRLGKDYRTDYLIVGKSSGGYEFVFIELEAPKGRITLKNKYKGEAFRKGMNQIIDWKNWLEEHNSSLAKEFHKLKSKKPESILPKEFRKIERLRLHFVVIAGRRANFNDYLYQLRLRTLDESKIRLLHYDNLIDAADGVIGKSTY